MSPPWSRLNGCCLSLRFKLEEYSTVSQKGSALRTTDEVDIGRYLAILPKMMERRRLEGEVRTHMEGRARVMKALAHPSRLFIVDELSRGERCVCDLTEMIGVDVSTVSKHLAVLKAAGLVLDDRRGVQVFYRLRVPCVLNFFGCVEAVLEETARELITVSK